MLQNQRTRIAEMREGMRLNPVVCVSPGQQFW
jgi:hypothetical protein